LIRNLLVASRSKISRSQRLFPSLSSWSPSWLPQAQQLATRRLVPYIVRDGQLQFGIRPTVPSMAHPARRVVPNGPVGRKLQQFQCISSAMHLPIYMRGRGRVRATSAPHMPPGENGLVHEQPLFLRHWPAGVLWYKGIAPPPPFTRRGLSSRPWSRLRLRQQRICPSFSCLRQLFGGLFSRSRSGFCSTLNFCGKNVSCSTQRY
jgi:hypothetical protein